MQDEYCFPEDLKIWLQSCEDHKNILLDGQVLEKLVSSLEEDISWDEKRIMEFKEAGGVVKEEGGSTVLFLNDETFVKEFERNGDTYYLVSIPAGEYEKVKLLEGVWIGLVDLYSSKGARDDVIAELYSYMGNYDHTEGMERLTNKFIENEKLTADILGMYGYRKEDPEDFLEGSD